MKDLADGGGGMEQIVSLRVTNIHVQLFHIYNKHTSHIE
jgi:hypothetical protein